MDWYRPATKQGFLPYGLESFWRDVAFARPVYEHFGHRSKPYLRCLIESSPPIARYLLCSFYSARF
jgi:hypothetical protein